MRLDWDRSEKSEVREWWVLIGWGLDGDWEDLALRWGFEHGHSIHIVSLHSKFGRQRAFRHVSSS